MGNFANCKPVRNIQFSSQGKAALNNIGRQLSDAQIGALLLMSSTFHGIFTRTSSTLDIAVNVGTADWEGIAQASQNWPNTIQQLIARDARMLSISTNGQEAEFWGVLAKCLRGY